MLKDVFKQWMQNPANCPKLGVGTPDIYIMYLNGLFVMLKEEEFLPFDGWEVLNSVSPTKSNKKKLEKIIELVEMSIIEAENVSPVKKTAMKNFKSAFSKLEDFIQSI